MHRQRSAAARTASRTDAKFVQETHSQSAAVPEVKGADSEDLLVALAAEALISGTLFNGFPASTLPRSNAPSSMARRSVCTSPVTCPVLHSCTLSRPVTLPSIFPRTMTSRAFTSAFTFPFGPMVRLPFVKLSFPSTIPSTKRSSLPVTSPLILIPWLMHAAARGEVGGAPENAGALAGALLDGNAGLEGTGLFPETPSGLESSFFHIIHLDIENWIFEAASPAGLGLRLGRAKRLH